MQPKYEELCGVCLLPPFRFRLIGGSHGIDLVNYLTFKYFQCLSDYCRYKSLKSSILSDNIFLFSTVYSIRLDQTSELFFDPKDEYITLWL